TLSYFYDLPTGYAIVFLGAVLTAVAVLVTSKKVSKS
ncbi:MAG: hypothetical protein QG617_1034, partial [Campylobacterota bacterium]|nr:hypothetical protein [Campylobacterota bacterium]